MIRTYRAHENSAPRRGTEVKNHRHPRKTFTEHRNAQQPPGRRLMHGDKKPRHNHNGNSAPRKSTKTTLTVPGPGENVRIIPLGGVEEIGKNMTVIEYKNDIVVVDVGFQFKEESTPGIDYILPNTKYLEERKEKIRAVIITHGHLDHIGGIPYIFERIGNPPLYSRMLTTVMVKKRQEEFPHLPALDIRIVEKDDRIKVGGLYVKFFAVSHTIPDSMGVMVETPYGNVVCTGDLKVDHIGGIPTEAEEKEFGKFAKEKVLFLMADSTNAEKEGFSIPESVVHENISAIIKRTTERLIIGTFASQLERIMRIIEIAEQYNKKVVVEGRSMKNNLEIIRHLKLLKTRPDSIITVQEMDQYPPERILVLATGAQGDEFAALMRMANKSHKFLKVTKRDTILLSSSIIPGNERAVQKLKDNLSRQGAKIIHYQVADVHASGHANREEAAWIIKRINPKFFMPIHGYHYMLRVHGDVAHSVGIPEKNIVIPDNGMIIEIEEKGEKLSVRKENVSGGLVLVDGFSIGDMQEVVLRDRQMLAQDGMFVIIASINPKTGRLRKSPDIISRGFIYLRESQELLQQTRIIVKKTIEDTAMGMNPINFEYIKGTVTDAVGRFLFQQTNKHPVVIPVLIGV